MSDFETVLHQLPVPLEPAQPRPSLRRTETTAEFVSQLIAERNRLAPQRTRRQTSPEGAVGAYATGGKIAVRRMPAGYRTTIVA